MEDSGGPFQSKVSGKVLGLCPTAIGQKWSVMSNRVNAVSGKVPRLWRSLATAAREREGRFHGRPVSVALTAGHLASAAAILGP